MIKLNKMSKEQRSQDFEEEDFMIINKNDSCIKNKKCQNVPISVQFL